MDFIKDGDISSNMKNNRIVEADEKENSIDNDNDHHHHFNDPDNFEKDNIKGILLLT